METIKQYNGKRTKTGYHTGWEAYLKLKPCPFCGKQPTTRWDVSEPYYEEGYNIDCCCIHINKIFKEEAIEVWNSRHPNQSLEPIQK